MGGLRLGAPDARQAGARDRARAPGAPLVHQHDPEVRHRRLEPRARLGRPGRLKPRPPCSCIAATCVFLGMHAHHAWRAEGFDANLSHTLAFVSRGDSNPGPPAHGQHLPVFLSMHARHA